MCARKRSKKRPIVTSPSKIIDEWRWLLKEFYSDKKMKKPFCFMCGCEKSEYETIYRHHTLTEFEGGRDVPANLILVCRDCHKIAPTRDVDESTDAVIGKLFFYMRIAQFLNLFNDIQHFTNKVNLDEFFKFIESPNVNNMNLMKISDD